MALYIDKQFKLIYFMIHKNASSSIRHFILKNKLNDSNLKYDWEQLTTMGKIKKHELDKYKDYFWFIFFRHPYDRVISAYNDKVKAMPGDQIYNSLYNPKMSLSDFVQYVINTPDNKIDLHVRSQTFGFNSYKDKMDFIGTVENFDEDIKKVKNILNLKFEPEILRKTKKRTITSSLKTVLYKRYIKDFKTFKSLNIHYDKEG